MNREALERLIIQLRQYPDGFDMESWEGCMAVNACMMACDEGHLTRRQLDLALTERSTFEAIGARYLWLTSKERSQLFYLSCWPADLRAEYYQIEREIQAQSPSDEPRWFELTDVAVRRIRRFLENGE